MSHITYESLVPPGARAKILSFAVNAHPRLLQKAAVACLVFLVASNVSGASPAPFVQDRFVV
ncbi:MAG: hypothetical protein NTX51_11710, partial [Verrucomicrobia bacterium]|nr:hypothetical protein [Verrucomicrobiota bacterium]